MIKGMGELHLEVTVDRLRREFRVEANVGAPQVAYRETITRTAEITYTHRKQTGGAGQFAEVTLVFEPLPSGSGVEFESKVVGGSVPQGVRGRGAEGVSARSPTAASWPASR